MDADEMDEVMGMTEKEEKTVKEELAKDHKKMIFIVLHYMAVEATMECIAHIIKNIDTESYKIIVVDNHSPDSSLEILKKKYKGNANIHLIHNDKNYGFTHGNNTGIHYALAHYDFDFMTVLNNDAFLIETALLHKCEMYYKKYQFALAGPRIIDKYGNNGNLPAEGLPDQRRIRRIIADAEKRLRLNTLHLLMPYIRIKEWKTRLYRARCALLNKNRQSIAANETKENVILHGCFWIFSSKYFEVFSGLPEKKGMFAEEETLLFHILKKKMTTLYVPDILVLHLEDASIKDAYKKEKERLLFIYKKRIETWKEYLETVNRES